MHEHHHEHPHPEPVGEARSPEETLALLNYMLKHNRQHAKELHELAHSVKDEAVLAQLHEAVDLLLASNDKLEAALSLWKGE